MFLDDTGQLGTAQQRSALNFEIKMCHEIYQGSIEELFALHTRGGSCSSAATQHSVSDKGNGTNQIRTTNKVSDEQQETFFLPLNLPHPKRIPPELLRFGHLGRR